MESKSTTRRPPTSKNRTVAWKAKNFYRVAPPRILRWPPSDVPPHVLAERVARIILKDRHALAACKRILRAIDGAFFTSFGFDHESGLIWVVGELTRLIAATVVGAVSDRATYVTEGTHGTGKSWKQIKALPERFEQMARERRQVNAGPFFARLRRSFPDSPTHLQLYATALTQRTTLDYTEPKQDLMESVKALTGAYRALRCRYFAPNNR